MIDLMGEVSPRLERRIRRDYEQDTADDVLTALADIPESLPLAEKQDAERLQASVVLGHAATWEAVVRRVVLIRRDWRDSLMASGLAHGNWPERLDEELGPA
jgi:hypothetical protein